MKRLNDSSDVPEARLGILPQTFTSSKKKTRLHSFRLHHEWSLPAASTMKLEEREFVVDSGASIHMVSKKDFNNSAELETMRTSRSPTTVMTANGEVQTKEEERENVKQLDVYLSKLLILVEIAAVLSCGKLCEDHGYTYHWTSGQKPHLIGNGKRIGSNMSNYVPFVVLGFSASSSSTTFSLNSPSSSSRDSVFDFNRYTENPVPRRSGSMSEEFRGDPLHESTETENKNKNEDREEVQRDISHELLDWLQEFRTNLVDESTSTELWSKEVNNSTSSHELPMEPRTKVEPGTGKHSV